MSRVKPAVSRVLLIGCGKAKAKQETSAELLYVGSLFNARRCYAQLSGARWWIVSAKYGLLSGHTLVKPYDLTIKDLSALDRVCWPLVVIQQLLSEFTEPFEPRRLLVEIHAGDDYAELLSAVLGAIGINFSRPLRGLSQGAQMAWYKNPPLEFR